MKKTPLRRVEDAAHWFTARSWSCAFSLLVYCACAKLAGPLSAYALLLASGLVFAFGVVCLVIGLAIIFIRAYRGESFEGEL